MKAIVVLALVLWSGIASATVQQLGRRQFDPVDQGGGGSVIAHTYQGTPNTLPYGHTNGWDPGLVTHALTMPSVVKAMQAMSQRGYVRRSDLDAGMTVDGYSNVVLSYEKPGAPLSQRMPVITVITEPYFVSSVLRWVPATQVVCGVFEDSAGVLRPVRTGADSAICIEGVGGTSALPAGALEAAIIAAEPNASDEDINYRYTAHDQYFPQDWRSSTSPGMQKLWNGYADDMMLTLGTSAALAVAGTWVNPPPNLPYIGFQIGISCWAAHTRYWMFPPDTTGIR